MAVTVPDWADTMLDLIGVSWPNIDEDAYRDMADSLREFAEDLEDDGQLANGHVERLLSSGYGEAMDALNLHWGKVKGTHIKDIASAARTIAGAMDTAATAVEGMKGAALVQLGYLAGETGLALSLIPVTGGLSALLGAGAIRATQEVVRRLIKECAEEAVGYIVAALTEPAVAALENLAADLVVQVGASAMGLQDGVDLGQAQQAGKEGFKDGVQGAKEGMHLASAGGPGGGGGGNSKGLHIEHGEHDHASTQLSGLSVNFHSKTAGKLGKAKSHHSRTRGRDSIAEAIDPVADKAVDALEKALKTMGDHVSTKLPKAVKQISTDHKNNDIDIGATFGKKGRDGDGWNGGKGGGKKGASHVKPNSLRDAKDDPRGKGIPLNKRRCATDPVDVASGEMVLAQTDLALPGVLPLVLQRTHISSYRYGQWFGRSWASTLDERIELDPLGGGAIWAREDGSLLVYPRLPRPQDPEPVMPLEGPRLPLSFGEESNAETSYRITDPDSGLTRWFTGSPYSESIAYWLSEIEDRNNNRIAFDRRGDGTPIAVTHEGGYQALLTVRHGRIRELALRTSDGPVTVMTYGYGEQDNLDAVTNSSGLPLRFTYDPHGRITSWTDRNDSTYQYVYDTAGRIARTIGPDGYLSSAFTYDTEARTTRYTDSTGATTTYQLNEKLQIVAETDPCGHITRTEYDEFDRIHSATDPLGRTTRLSYDAFGRPTALVRADGRRTLVTYNDLGLPATLTEPDGATWHHTYDERGNRTSLADPAGEAVLFTHDRHGAITSVTDAVGRSVRIARTRAGLPLTIADPAGSLTRHVYDDFGRPVIVTNPLGDTTCLEWSVEGQLTARTDPAGHIERWTFDGEGNCTSHTEPTGRTTQFEYSHFDLQTARITPDGVRHSFTHDTELRLTQVTNPHGLTWAYSYDPAGRLVEETDFDGHTLTYAYDAAGQLTTRTNAAGQRITYCHDSVGALTEKAIDGDVITYENDPCGRLLTATSPNATLAYDYDPVGRVIRESVNGRTLATACDAAGQRTLRTTPMGVNTAYTYDAAGYCASLTASGRTLTFDRDSIGHETTRRLGDAMTLTSTWGPAGRLLQRQLDASGVGRAPLSRTYSYRPDNRLTAISDGRARRRTFDLDQAGRVTAVSAPNWVESYAYDEMGNQIHASWPDRHPGGDARGDRTYTGARITRAGGIRYEHDAQGRVILRQKTRLSRKPDTWRYTWSAEDRLTAVTTPDGTHWRYLYDPLGRRIAKQRLAEDGFTVVEETLFTWDGSTLTEQTTRLYGGSEALTITWDHDGYTPLAQTETKALIDAPQNVIDQRFFVIVTDQIGTPTELVDEAGCIAWRSRSTVWGASAWNRDATAQTPLRFPGQYFDPETELHHNYFRHYDPETARYLTLDPLGLDPDPNPATYVDNPHTESDPLGLTPCDEGDVTWGGRVRFGVPGPGGRATGMRATVMPDMTGGQTRPQAKVPGYQKYKGLNATHLLGAQIGGSNKDSRNFVTMHRYANSPVMRKIEDQIRQAADRGETIEYSVTPIYRTSNDPSDVVPVGLTIEARNGNGFQFTPYEGGSPTNTVTVLNVPKQKP
ncbi:DUF6531 domain-containing protein [Streptomyces sp. NPDC001700]